MQMVGKTSSLTRRQVLRGVGASSAALLAGCRSGPEYRRPNILFVMTDDQTAAQMSCAGHPILQTPNMDRLANEGVRFSTRIFNLMYELQTIQRPSASLLIGARAR